MRVVSILFVALLLVEAWLGVQGIVCKQDVETMKEAVRNNLQGLEISHVIRLFFHDCVGDACDGCVNLDDPNNAGLWQNTIRKLNALYTSNGYADYGMSYADFYTLSTIVAIEEGVKNANADLPQSERVGVPNIPFQSGRQDCATAPYSSVVRPLPPAALNHADMMSFFKDMFDFNTEETVAIMGAHTMGGASGDSGSGFFGFFKEDIHEGVKFDNRYYTLLKGNDLTWRQVDNAERNGFPVPRWQWEGYNCRGTQKSMLFQADLANYLEVSLDSDGKSSCGIGTCPVNAEGNAAVTKYEANYEDWLDDFKDAFLKMSAHGVTGTLSDPSTC